MGSIVSFLKKGIKKLYKYYKNPFSNCVFIHIGKCGGSSVMKQLKKYDFKHVHVEKVKYINNKKYFLIIRNPISRFVSAFNWRYKLVIQDKIQENRFKGEKLILEKYNNVNDLAENIYNTNGELVLNFQKPNNYIHHITEDIYFYIGEFLDIVKSEEIGGILTTENLNSDFKNTFNIELDYHYKKNKSDDYLSKIAINNLVSYLKKDFECIDRLDKMKLLSKEQYKVLSNKKF